MAIDLATQKALSLKQAARLVPPCRENHPTHPTRLLRWITNGKKGPDGSIVRLEALLMGTSWVTTAEALQEFAERLTPRPGGDSGPRTPATRSRAVEKAEKELDRLGI